ncbi:sugar isomerase, partial [Terriglobus sp. YAF25]
MERSVSSLPQEKQERVWRALDGLQIEIPSWGFANTGTRFGKFIQAAAATNLTEKFADASEVHRLTGITPTVALHVLWDLPEGEGSVAQ